MNDARLNRLRHEELATIVANPPNSAQGIGATVLCTTTTITTYPTSPTAMFACNPTMINYPSGEIEGAPANYVVDTTVIMYVTNTGSQIPPNGTRLLAHGAGGRFTCRFD